MIGVGICRSLLQLRIVYTKVLKETEKSIPVNNKLGNLILFSKKWNLYTN